MVRNAMSFLAAAFLLITVTKATTHIVGDKLGWSTNVDYKAWASKNPIKAGDTLVFNYVPYFHNVLHVTKEDYDSCTTTSPLQSDSGGLSITEPLKEGVWYFICGAPGHCEIGMKLKAQTIGYSGSDDSPSPPSETSKPPPAVRSWQPNSAHKFSSTGYFALTFALMMLTAF